MTTPKCFRNKENQLLKIYIDNDPLDPLEYEETVHINTFTRNYKSVTPTKHNRFDDLLLELSNQDEDVLNNNLDKIIKIIRKQGYYVEPITITDHTSVYYNRGTQTDWDTAIAGIAWCETKHFDSKEKFAEYVDSMLEAYNKYINEQAYFAEYSDKDETWSDTTGSLYPKYGEVTEEEVRNGLDGFISKDETWIEIQPIKTISYPLWEDSTKGA